MGRCRWRVTSCGGAVILIRPTVSDFYASKAHVHLCAGDLRDTSVDILEHQTLLYLVVRTALHQGPAPRVLLSSRSKFALAIELQKCFGLRKEYTFIFDKRRDSGVMSRDSFAGISMFRVSTSGTLKSRGSCDDAKRVWSAKKRQGHDATKTSTTTGAV